MIYFYILILGFISGVCMETCPKQEDIFPCKCQTLGLGDLRVECNFDSDLETTSQLELLQQALNSLRGKTVGYIFIKDINASLTSNIFSRNVIKGLEFRSCIVDTLTNDDQPVLLGLENHLELLSFQDSSLVPAKLRLGHLKKLKRLHLYNCNITELDDDWLGNAPPPLETLYILESNIRKIGSNAFSRLNNLETLMLEDNRFRSIKRSMFPNPADRLKYIYLGNNELTELPVDLFRNMSSVNTIFLGRNGITTLDERTWSPIWQQLYSLSLDDNEIVCDDRLNWIFKSKKGPEFIYGECSAPGELKGKNLVEFFKSRSRREFQ